MGLNITLYAYQIYAYISSDRKIMVWDFLCILLIPAFICSLYMKYRSKICTYEMGHVWVDPIPTQLHA